MFIGPAASDRVVGNGNVVGGVMSVLALVAAVVVLWPRVRHRTVPVVSTGQVQAATEYLARETLRYWRAQAKDRRITTPSPAAVRWSWASEEVAVSAGELWPGDTDSGGPAAGPEGEALTAGVVTRLREQLYDRLDGKRARVVILGGAGAGKTAAMLLLLIDVLEQLIDDPAHRPAGSGQPVPVWLTLGGWNPDTTPLRDWAAATLTRDYPGLAAREYGGGQSMAAELVRTGRVALFLDGLDEMPPARQGKALQVIDRDAAGLRVVLTSRPEQYLAAVEQGRLYGAAVIDVLPVDADQAEAFLLAEQLGPRHRRWQQVTHHLRAHPDSVAARTLTNPLALSLARDTYAHADPTELLDTHAHPTPEALLQHLLARSLALAYPDPAEHRHATRWLSWIAQHMDTSRDLRWWDIPTWTPRWQLRLAFGLTGGIAGGLAFGIVAGIGPAVQLVVAEVIWALRGRRVRFMSLLQTALDRQVLRQAGAVYQFRHAALQDLLAAQGSTEPATSAQHSHRPKPAT
jgi:hypothetical protein